MGLNFITLGQPLSTLSGGEYKCIKLANELHKKGSIYVMDEPIVIEHNLDVISQANWIIDMGPDGGSKHICTNGKPSTLDDGYSGSC
ncbi:hypothetical protein GCM10010912_40270 [Paenibacillus albidus]|uniref:UvrABC system protein A n=1 Tax=Paenibacillus albidus TaxID=2041023 RepID=A0A917CL71_9BACL|nr:hypothetical protein GCM10010912_40270 [Paenibacillus albidus]